MKIVISFSMDDYNRYTEIIQRKFANAKRDDYMLYRLDKEYKDQLVEDRVFLAHFFDKYSKKEYEMEVEDEYVEMNPLSDNSYILGELTKLLNEHVRVITNEAKSLH